jgi:hypothetical protein
MDLNFYLFNYPALRRALAAGLLLIALAIFNTWTDMWKVQKELTQYGVTARAVVTGRSSHFLVHDEEDGDVWTYETKYDYAASGLYGQTVTYSGESGYYDTYQKAEAGWIQVIYSSRNPFISLPSGEFTPTGPFLAWVVPHWGEYLVTLGFLIAALWTDKIDLCKLWIALQRGR